nr:hypothetical protein [Tanacetum cinerariifolium]
RKPARPKKKITDGLVIYSEEKLRFGKPDAGDGLVIYLEEELRFGKPDAGGRLGKKEHSKILTGVERIHIFTSDGRLDQY